MICYIICFCTQKEALLEVQFADPHTSTHTHTRKAQTHNRTAIKILSALYCWKFAKVMIVRRKKGGKTVNKLKTLREPRDDHLYIMMYVCVCVFGLMVHLPTQTAERKRVGKCKLNLLIILLTLNLVRKRACFSFQQQSPASARAQTGNVRKDRSTLSSWSPNRMSKRLPFVFTATRAHMASFAA